MIMTVPISVIFAEFGTRYPIASATTCVDLDLRTCPCTCTARSRPSPFKRLLSLLSSDSGNGGKSLC